VLSATPPARPWTWPAAALPAFAEPQRAAAAGYAGPGPRALPLPIGAHTGMVGMPAIDHIAPPAFMNLDRLIGRVPTMPHVTRMPHGLLPGAPVGARIPGLRMPALNIPRLAALSGAPIAAVHPEPALVAALGAPAPPVRPFEIKPGGHAASPEMNYVILGSRSRGASVGERPARVITETHFVEPPHERDRDGGGVPRNLKASVGRDHRPQPSGAGGVGKEARETPQGTVNTPDLDRLAAQIYGRIKQRLAIDRERRGFVR